MELSRKALSIAPSLTLKIDALSKEMKKAGKDVIGFGAGEPDFDTPEYIKAAACEALSKGFTKYTPASGLLDLKRAVVDRYQRKYGLEYAPEQVVISNGGKHSLYNTFQCLLNPGDEVLILAPYWLTYPELVRMADGVPVIVETKEENDFQPETKEIEKAITSRTKAIVVNSPSNPCGCIYSEETKREIAELAKRHNFYIISDEIYDELVYVPSKGSIACVNQDAQDRTIIVNGMSKAYAMTGWRIGYTIAPKELSKIMGSYQSQATSNPNSIAQYASIVALDEGDEEIARMVEIFRERSKIMHDLVNAIPGLECRMPEGAFYSFVNISGLLGKKFKGQEIEGSVGFAELLLQEKMTAVVPGAAFGADGFVRLSYATSEDNIRRGLKRVEEFVRELED